MTKNSKANVIGMPPHEKANNVGTNEKQRAKVAERLSHFLASTYLLYQKSLFYHWNVTGPHFLALHTLFEQHYQELHTEGDKIAERIRALGYFAPGTYAEFEKLSSVKEDKKVPSDYKIMVANLLKAHEHCSMEANEVLSVAEKASDEVTVDLMVQRMAFHDKAAWMLRSLQ